jgi:UDP-N-acetylglucosamine 2-epimerase (non-hydrolysing)
MDLENARSSGGFATLDTEAAHRPVVATVFGTRPEAIKLAPVLAAFDESPVRSIVIASGQHTDLVQPFVDLFGLRVDRNLGVMRPGQTPNEVLGRLLPLLDAVFAETNPDFVIVQGDTTTALAASLAAFHRKVPVGHVEAGLRTETPKLPFPEEMNRRLISRLADWHFAATQRNRATLLAEGTSADRVFVTGNPVVDALHRIRDRRPTSPILNELLEKTAGQKRIVLTTHRRENFGATMTGHLAVLRTFVAKHADVALIFPVHPNPSVRATAEASLGGRERIIITAPLEYPAFVGLMSSAWLLVSDSGGIQEEAPSLGRPLLVLREQTERPEAIEAGVARLTGTPQALAEALDDAYQGLGVMTGTGVAANPFGDGHAGWRIAQTIARILGVARVNP